MELLIKNNEMLRNEPRSIASVEHLACGEKKNIIRSYGGPHLGMQKVTTEHA